MTYKDYWSSPEDFHGPDGTNGLVVLDQVPIGIPAPLPLKPIKEKFLFSLRDCYPALKNPQVEEWCEYIIAHQKLPDIDHSSVPDDYFDFRAFRYMEYVCQRDQHLAEQSLQEEIA